MAVSLQDDKTLFVAEVYNNCILHFLEDPFDSLELIRDKDCLVSYRLLKESKNSLLVVFMHQWCEREFGFRMGRQSWSLFGIPLVARISSITDGSQIHNAYMKLLWPFLSSDEVDIDDTENSDNELVKMLR